MNIADIAKMAGVSSAAVSRYFNNGYVSEAKKEAIRKVVEETGYRPSVQAQTLRTKKTKMIGVILPKIDSASIGRMVAGILKVLNESGYQVLLADTQNNPQKELEYLKTFSEKQVDGVLFIATTFTEQHKKQLNEMKVPCVVIAQYLSGFNCVYFDDYRAFYTMTKNMLKEGRRNLAYIGVTLMDEAVGVQRYKGYCDAVREAGLEQLAEQKVISDFAIEDGYQKAEQLLKKYEGIDGIICATDAIAIGALQYLKTRKIKVPQEIVVSGHGDTIMAKVMTPTLTTIHFEYEEAGELSSHMLLDSIEKGTEDVKELKLGFRIIKGESF